MNQYILTAKQIAAYTRFLRQEERASATVEKYSRDVLAFAAWLKERPVTKEAVAQWKELLLETICATGIRVSEVKYITVEAARNGRTDTSLSRVQIWREMKRICQAAGVELSKVFPHNLRHLFATTFYRVTKDIAKLADILGHSSINTTRIYLLSTDAEHLRCLERLGLVNEETEDRFRFSSGRKGRVGYELR